MRKKGVGEAELRNLEQRVRDTPTLDIFPSPVLNERQWSVDFSLRQELGSTGWMIFAGSALSAFFDPMAYVGRDRDVIFESSVLFAVTSAPPGGEAVVMVIDAGQSALEDFLTRQEVLWLHDAPEVPPSEFARAIGDRVLPGNLRRIGERRPIRHSEFQLASALLRQTKFELERHADVRPLINASPDVDLAKDLADGTPRLLHEVSLWRMLPRLRPRLSDAELWIAKTSPLDVLVHGRAAANRPLLAIEIDDSRHESKKQADKDRLKDAVLVAIHLPLVRITQDDADFWKSRESLDREARRKLGRFASLLSDVVQVIAGLMAQFARRATDEDGAANKVHQLEDQVANGLFGKRHVELDEGQRMEVFVSVMDSEARQEMDILHAEEQRFRDEDLVNATEQSNWSAELAVVATPPVIHGDIDKGCWATTTLTVKGRRPMPLRSPTIRAIGLSLDAEALNRRIAACLVQTLDAEVRERVRMQSPAAPRR